MSSEIKTPTYKSPKNLALAIQISIGAVVFVVVVRAIAFAVQIILLSSGQIDLAGNVQPIISITELIQPFPYVIAGVCFIIWMRRTFRNLRAFKVEGLQCKEWYSVWGFFIPVASLYIPMALVNEIWKASNPAALDGTSWKQSKDSRLVVAWWIAWISFAVTNVVRLMFASQKYQSNFLRLLLSPEAFFILHGIYCAAGVMAILVVREITSRQEKKYELLSPTPDQ